MAEPAPDVVVEMFSQPRLLAGVRSLVDQIARRTGFDDRQAGKICLAVDEALCNVINHGYQKREDGRIWIRIWAEPGDPPRLRFVIEDRARTVDPATIRPRNLEDVRPGGLGVHIIREVMDEVRYEPREDGGMRLILAKVFRASEADE